MQNLYFKIQEYMTSDDESPSKTSMRLTRRYMSLNDEQKKLIDTMFIALMGYGLGTLIKEVDKEAKEHENHRFITLPNGDYIQIKYDDEGVVYDRFNSKDEHLESYGYDLYTDISSIQNNVEKPESITIDIMGYHPDDENGDVDESKMVYDFEEMTNEFKNKLSELDSKQNKK